MSVCKHMHTQLYAHYNWRSRGFLRRSCCSRTAAAWWAIFRNVVKGAGWWHSTCRALVLNNTPKLSKVWFTLAAVLTIDSKQCRSQKILRSHKKHLKLPVNLFCVRFLFCSKNLLNWGLFIYPFIFFHSCNSGFWFVLELIPAVIVQTGTWHRENTETTNSWIQIQC